MSRILLVKLLRDLRASMGRLVLMTVAIATSLTVFSAVLYTRTITDREIRQSYLSTNPAAASIQLEEPIEASRMAAIVAAVRNLPGVSDAAGRFEFVSPVKGQTNPLQIFVSAPDDPRRLARFEVEQGSWPPRPNEILIERGALDLLNLKIGDTISVRNPDGEPISLRVSGVTHDPSLAPSFQEQKGYGFASTTTGFGLDELKIQTERRDWDGISATGERVARWLTDTYGLAVREVQVPPPGRHPHQGQLDALLLAMLVFGSAAVLLSAILVATMLNGLFTQQIPQIGMMKAIGARSGSIRRFYLLPTLVVSASATAVALAPGILFSRFWVPSVLTGLLGMDAASLVAPVWTYPLVILVGIGVPLLMTMVPLLRTSRTTVRAALDHTGTAPAGDGRLGAWLSRVRGLDRSLLMGLRNPLRRRARTLLSIGLLASAGTLFVAGMSTLSGVQAIPERATGQRLWDVEVQLAAPVPAEQASRVARGVTGVEQVETWSVAPSAVAEAGRVALTRAYPDQAHGSIGVTAVPMDTALFNPSQLMEGRWLRPGDTDAIVVNQIAKAQYAPDLSVGDTVQLSVGGRATSWKVVGIVEEAFVGTGVYVTQDGFAAVTGRGGLSNNLRISATGDRAAVAAAVDQALHSAGIKVNAANSVERMEQVSTGHMLPIIMILLAIAGAMALVGIVGLASTMSTSVLERTREFGVMHAIGARPGAVRRIVTSEGIAIALASCLVAIAPTMILTSVMGAGLGTMFLYAPLPYRLSAPAAGAWITVAVLGAVLATRIPARRASRLTIREAIAQL